MKKTIIVILLLICSQSYSQTYFREYKGKTRITWDSAGVLVFKPLYSLKLPGSIKLITSQILNVSNTLYFLEDTYELQTTHSNNLLTVDSLNGFNFNRPIKLVSNSGAVTGSNDSDTLQGQIIKATTKSLTTAGLTAYTYTLYNSDISTSSMIEVTLSSASAGIPMMQSYIPSSGSVAITIYNMAAVTALNNTVTFTILILN